MHNTVLSVTRDPLAHQTNSLSTSSKILLYQARFGLVFQRDTEITYSQIITVPERDHPIYDHNATIVLNIPGIILLELSLEALLCLIILHILNCPIFSSFEHKFNLWKEYLHYAQQSRRVNGLNNMNGEQL